MKLIKTDSKLRCELGVCKNKAEYALVMDRTGIRRRIYMCRDCAKKLYEAIKETLKEKTERQKTDKARNQGGARYE